LTPKILNVLRWAEMLLNHSETQQHPVPRRKQLPEDFISKRPQRLPAIRMLTGQLVKLFRELPPAF
jgi:hypothetical protein